MPRSQQPRPEQLAAFADVVLDLAHKLDIKNPDLRDVVPLTGTEIAVIRQIHRVPRSTPSQIADAVRLQRSNVSTALRTLEAKGLVLREQAPENARSVVLVPTERAAEDVARINVWWAERLQAAQSDDLALVVAALGALERIAGELGGR